MNVTKKNICSSTVTWKVLLNQPQSYWINPNQPKLGKLWQLDAQGWTGAPIEDVPAFYGTNSFVKFIFRSCSMNLSSLPNFGHLYSVMLVFLPLTSFIYFVFGCPFLFSIFIECSKSKNNNHWAHVSTFDRTPAI